MGPFFAKSGGDFFVVEMSSNGAKALIFLVATDDLKHNLIFAWFNDELSIEVSKAEGNGA